MFVLSIWLLLAGYAIAITGKRNLGVSYQPQADMSIKAVDEHGNAAKTYSLQDVITCGEPSGSPGGQPAPPGSPKAATPPTPLPAPRPIGLPNLQPAPVPLPGLIPIPRLPLPAPNPGRLPVPDPGGLVGDVFRGTGVVMRDLEQGLRSTLGGLQGAVGRLPRIHLPTARPLL